MRAYSYFALRYESGEMQMRRRDLLRLAGLAGAAWLVDSHRATAYAATPILDAHIHLFDPRRPGGIPWPKPDDTVIYKPSLPERYAKIAEPLGVVGAIAVEASPALRDNDWVLEIAAHNPIIVGFVGDLTPGSPGYEAQLDRLRANPIFLGIRYGNLWQRDLGKDMGAPGFIDGLRKLSSYGLEMDSANPDPELIRALVEVSDRIPELRIVIDHLPASPIPAPGPARTAYWSLLRHLSRNPNVFIKLSEIPVRIGQRVPLDLAYYRDHLDMIWGVFGEDHILYGSDWPNSDHLATYADTLRLVRAYVQPKGSEASRKFFWENSIAAYKWKPRRANQKLT